MSLEIVIVGSERQSKEVVAKFGVSHHYFKAERVSEARKFFGEGRIVFDFTVNGSFDRDMYADHLQMSVFLDTTLTSLSGLGVGGDRNSVFGFCGFPTFVNRAVMEVSVPGEKSLSNLKLVFEKLGSDYVVVADKPGLVTPRVICMIINEAYYTVEEGTATREDID